MNSSTPPNRSRATLSQVAERAGVSVTTASLVLGGHSGKHRISEKTFQRVHEVATELDYVPNLLVRSLQRGRTGILSFVNAFRHRQHNDIYMDRLSTAIENSAGRSGYDVLIHCDFSRPPEETYRALNGGRADGVLFFAPLPDDPLLAWFQKSRLPVVLINTRDPANTLPSVKEDVHGGMRLVAESLLQAGHRRIAILMEEGSNFPDAHERAELLCGYLKPHGVLVPETRHVRIQRDQPMDISPLLASPDPPTALFCWRDRLAYWALEYCEQTGISVPDQLSIIGYDGIQWPATTRHIAASVQVDLERLADAAVSRLHQRINEVVEAPVEETLPVTFDFGTTLGPVPGP